MSKYLPIPQSRHVSQQKTGFLDLKAKSSIGVWVSFFWHKSLFLPKKCEGCSRKVETDSQIFESLKKNPVLNRAPQAQVWRLPFWNGGLAGGS